MIKKKLTSLIVLRSMIFWLIIVALSFPYNVLALLIFPLPHKWRHYILTTWGTIFTFGAKYVCGVKYQVNGKENIPKFPAIIASNHQSMWETVAFNEIFPPHVWILKRELLWFPLFGWTLATLSPIAINRNNRKKAMEQLIKQGTNRIKRGLSIMLFPEGTRAKPGKLNHFKAGVGRMAKSLNLPVIPVSHNAGFVLAKRSWILYPMTINVNIAKPVFPDSDATAEELTKQIEDIVRNNLPHAGA